MTFVPEKSSGRVRAASLTGATTSGTRGPATFLCAQGSFAFPGTLAHSITNAESHSVKKAKVRGSRRPESNGYEAVYGTAALPVSHVGGTEDKVTEPANDVKPRGHLTTADVVAIRLRRAEGAKSAALGRVFGISQSMVCLITVGIAYPDLPGPITRRRMRGPLADRLRALAVPGKDPDDCWGWLGRTGKQGYARISFGGTEHGAHRCALELKLGRKLRDDEQTRHMCNNPPCTNPRHLEPGSAMDNVHDMIRAGRARIGQDGTSCKLTDEDVRDIRERASLGKVNYEALGRLHGVTGAAIKKVILGKTWRHLLTPPAASKPDEKGIAA